MEVGVLLKTMQLATGGLQNPTALMPAPTPWEPFSQAMQPSLVERACSTLHCVGSLVKCSNANSSAQPYGGL